MNLQKGASPGRLLLAVLFAGLFLEGLFFVVQGRFNIDEGLHLNAGRLLYAHGRMLYSDFPFSQGPGAAYFYGIASAHFENPILVGRLFSLCMASICVAGMAAFVNRMVGRMGVLLVLLWTSICFPAIWAFTQIRTEPVAITLTMLATIAFWFRKGAALRWALAPVLLVWATTFRLTTILPLLAVCLLIAFELRHRPRRLMAVAGIVFVNGLVASMPMLMVLDESYFHVVVSQANRAERFGWGSIPFFFRFRSLGDPATSYPGLMLMSLIPLAVVAMRGRNVGQGEEGAASDLARKIGLLFVMALLVYFPHSGSRIGFSQYYANAALLLILALAIGAPLLARRSQKHAAFVWAAVAIAWLFSAVMGVRGIETWVHLGEPTITRFDSLRERIQHLAPDGCEMLTFETHLAVQVGCDVTPGLEYSLFSFFPQFSSEEARAHGVLNGDLLNEALLRSPPEFVALTWSARSRIEGSTDRKGARPSLSGMRNRYELLRKLDVPIGPTYRFWVEVFVYARSDLIESGDEMANMGSQEILSADRGQKTEPPAQFLGVPIVNRE